MIIVVGLFAIILFCLCIYLPVMVMLSVLYIFQIKEYRFDRLRSQSKEDGVFGLLRKNFEKIPAASIRNMLIILIAIVLFIAMEYAVLDLNNQHTNSTAYSNCDREYTAPAPPGQNNVIRICGQQLGFRIPTYKNVLTFFAKATILILVINPILAALSTIAGVVITEPFARYKRSKLIARAKEKARNSKAYFVGISGTYGKSTTKEYLYHILSEKFKVGKTDENMNTDVGVAVSILKNLKPDTEFFVAEVGAYKLGEVRRAASIFSPRAAIMLPFGNQHMDLFGSKENLVAAESEILEFIPKEGAIFVNADIPELQYVLQHSRGAVKTYSITKKADIYAEDIQVSEKGSKAKVSYNHQAITIETKLLGKHVIQNLLPAIALATDSGMTENQIAGAIASLEYIPGKLSVHHKNNAIILNDTGNSSLNGFLAAIDTIKLFNRKNIYILSKGIIELGKEKELSYERIIMQINKDHIQLATTDKLFKIFDKSNSVTIMRNEDEFYNFIADKLDDQAAVLLEGKFTKTFINKFL